MKRFAVIVGLVAAGAFTGGCSGGGMNHPFKRYTKDQQLAATAVRGYTEVQRENVIYVVSSPQAVKRVKEGKEPLAKVAAIGFGPNGEKVVFEASKDGLENALMQEFERRHATAQAAM